MKSGIIYFLGFALLTFTGSCSTKTLTAEFEKENYKHCYFSENSELEVYSWYVPKGEGCCTGNAINGVHETWEHNEGITRSLVSSEIMNASRIQKKYCKKD